MAAATSELGPARWLFAVASAGAAMSAAAADAMFLAELGPGSLGEAVAASSALLAVVLAVVGGLADRLDRRRLLAGLALASTLVLVGLALAAAVAPRVAAIAALIAGKQLAAATDLALWVAIGERLDARRSRRALPALAAAGGAGAAVGGALVVPLAELAGARGVLVAAAALLAVAAALALRLPATRAIARGARVARGAGEGALQVVALIGRAWRDGARAVRDQPLARQLAVVVLVAGAFGSLAYFALGVEATATADSSAELAALLGGVRAVGQLVTLGVQLAIAPRLLARLGTGSALLLAPAVALIAGLGLVAAPVLAVAIALQMSSRVLDAGIETPAERLAQTLLPAAARGRVAGVLDGTAKRAGAVAGGLLAAALAGLPLAFAAAVAGCAALWLAAAWRLARRLPQLAVAQVAQAAHVRRGGAGDGGLAEGPALDARAAGLLARELAGPHPARAAELFADLDAAGRLDARSALLAAATGGAPAWPSLVRVLARHPRPAAPEHGPALFAAAPRGGASARSVRGAEAAVRAIGLAGGVAPAELARLADGAGPGLALTAAVAAQRLAGDDPLPALADAARGEGEAARAAVAELVVELAGAGVAARAFEVARVALRALRRDRGAPGDRAAAFGALARWAEVATPDAVRGAERALLRSELAELARACIDRAASQLAPAHALTSLVRAPADDASALEVAAALRALGVLLADEPAPALDDIRRMTLALGEPDDDVRAAAEEALVGLGAAAASELVAAVAFGRRRARDRAAALLAELPVTPAALDALIADELGGLGETRAALAGLAATAATDALLVRRLDERLREIAHTVLLLVAARRRSPAIARAAVAWGTARGRHERARTLAVVEAALPRALVSPLVDAVDELAPAERATALRRTGAAIPNRDHVIRGELAGRDRLARALALHALEPAGRGEHRDTIAAAARAEAERASPAALLRRLHAAAADPSPTTHPAPGGVDMPSRIESLIAIGRVPLFASLSTRQLADVAERARWISLAAGGVVVGAGDVLDALVIVDDGELALGERRFVRGEVVDELACVAPQPVARDLRAVRATRAVRLERADFEELVDDVPGLAAAICRALGERARRADDASYHSPLVSRA